MMPLYFGPSERALYGVYESPAPGGNRAMVICQPFGIEYFNAHRVARDLARRLADVGFHTLRFDYSGTGDSARELDEVRSEDWLEDIRLALGELRDMSGVGPVGLIGLRMGAALALVTASHDPDVDRLVLWDPVLTRGPGDGAPPDVPTCEQLMTETERAMSADTLLVWTSKSSSPPDEITAGLEARAPRLDRVHEREFGAWESDEGIATRPVPARSLRAIVEWCDRTPSS